MNPAGVKLDDITSNDFFLGDRSWEPVWDVATVVDSLGWVAEMRIPFSQLRFPQQRDQLWGVQVFRWVLRKGEMSQLVPKIETGDASINPDFGQVEQDPALVNLSAFEQFLEERRPFFVEGASIFDFGGTGPYIGFGGTPRYFYSRRVGRAPGVDPGVPDGGYADVPVSFTILGAAKLTGKTAGGWSLGVLDGVTGRETARLDQCAARKAELLAEPVSRILRRFRLGITDAACDAPRLYGTGSQPRCGHRAVPRWLRG